MFSGGPKDNIRTKEVNLVVGRLDTYPLWMIQEALMLFAEIFLHKYHF